MSASGWKRRRRDSSTEFTKWLNDEPRKRISSPVDRADEVLGVNVTDAASFIYRNKPQDVTMPDGATLIEGPLAGRKAIKLDNRASFEFPNVDAFSADKPFTVAGWIQAPKSEDSFVVVSQTDPESRFRGWALELNGRRPTLRVAALNRDLHDSQRNRRQINGRTVVSRRVHL